VPAAPVAEPAAPVVPAPPAVPVVPALPVRAGEPFVHAARDIAAARVARKGIDFTRL
jgi:hypothetical protein